MNEAKYINLRCIPISQPIGTFYIGAIESKDLMRISYADIRRIEERDVEKYIGIQRPLSDTRVAEIKQYVNNLDATFPTSIILAVSSEDAEYDEASSTMKILSDDKVAKIIDGQHRIAGLKGFAGKRYEINVTIFIDMDIEDQAMVFATINLKQTKVNKSLMYDLYDFAKSRSPQKTCHNIAKLLNTKVDSPFKDKIKILGLATGKPQETITQATFVERLMRYISDNPMKDRDIIKRKGKLSIAEGKYAEKYFLRQMFIDEQDAKIAKILWNYFKAVEKRWPTSWLESIPGNILNRTTGFNALMKFLKDAYLEIGPVGTIPTVEQYYIIFEKIKIRNGEFTTEEYKPGSSGEGDLYRDLMEKSRIGK